MDTETANQRKWRLIREAQESKAIQQAKLERKRVAELRKQAKWAREGRRERAYHTALVDDHNLDPGDDA